MNDERITTAGPFPHFNLIIRTARGSDASGIGLVHATSQHATYRGIVSDAWLARITHEERTQWWTRALRSHGDDWLNRVAVVEGEIMGFSCTGPVGLGPGPAVAAYDLYCLYVRPGCERRGLGRALLEHTIDELQRREIADLQVLCLRDTHAHRFYEALGGQLVEEGHHPDDDGTLLAHRIYRYALTTHDGDAPRLSARGSG